MKSSELRISKLIISNVKCRLIVEFLPRIEKCLNLLTTEEIWKKPNTNSNSIGNLILHLEGNVKQYILSALGDLPDNRERAKEFEFTDKLPAEVLNNRLFELMDQVGIVLDKLQVEDLETIKKVQCFEESVLSILIHVTEHFSYHTGQIALLTKLYKDKDLGFYSGLDLDKTRS